MNNKFLQCNYAGVYIENTGVTGFISLKVLSFSIDNPRHTSLDYFWDTIKEKENGIFQFKYSNLLYSCCEWATDQQ